MTLSVRELQASRLSPYETLRSESVSINAVSVIPDYERTAQYHRILDSCVRGLREGVATFHAISPPRHARSPRRSSADVYADLRAVSPYASQEDSKTFAASCNRADAWTYRLPCPFPRRRLRLWRGAFFLDTRRILAKSQAGKIGQ